MKYVFLAYAGEEQWNAMFSGERDALWNECLTSDDLLRRRGHLLVVESLQSSRTAITVRVQNGKLSVADGPFATTTEQLIAIFTVNARDLNEAIQIASNMPHARAGPIEVRPIVERDQQSLTQP